jgi:tetrapyrrole methylase family protein / MazG family protein
MTEASTKSDSNWQQLLTIIAALRAPDGCPWDREQTHRSLVPFAIEETFELAEAIEAGADPAIVEELGDVLLQVVLHAQIANETSRFSIDDIVNGISEKMIRRHPHVFGPETKSGTTTTEVLERWQELKKTEKADAGAPKKATTGIAFRFDVPLALPALQRSAKIGEKTARFRFDWPNWQSVLTKVDEELNEVKVALKESPTQVYNVKDAPETGTSRDPVACEIGDLLFSVAQLARHRGLDPEQCLREANARFERRFGILQDLESARSAADGRNWESRSQEELEKLWGEAKIEELKS